MSLRRPLSVLILIVGFALASSGLRAAQATDPAGFITDLVNQALKALDTKDMTDQDRSEQFRKLLDSDFDMPRISRFVLGPYWREASDQDKRAFLRLFEDYVVRSYAARFSQYSGEKVKVTGARPESESSTLVTSQIIRTDGAPPAKVDWRVHKGNDGFKIVDVDVEGVSMVLTQREQFSSVIQRSGGTVAALNKELEQKLASGDNSLAPKLLPKQQ